ncbi:MAG: quinoprotein dehydrogenase-associated putative ABC transporter substrate-binding protein [Burkholderiales bacterium]|nr:quinoprotein dehydrogenase-associated putative ABC transporter substrate-binding protein [Burkholderiales bacterium]
MSHLTSARHFRRLAGIAAALAIGCLGCVVGAGAQDLERKALRVCQDPNNLPFSNTAAEGIENRLADLFGKQLGLPVTYYTYPERFAFVRNTLKYKLPGDDYPCDIMMGVPVGFDQVSVTKPYYRSTYALVIPQGHGMDAVHSGDDFLHLDPALLGRLRIGIYDRSPASAWLVKHGLVDRGVPYHILNADPAQYPGQIIENDLASGKIDVAIVWGPIAGFFAKRVKSPQLAVIALHSEPGVRFDYPMAMGVRYGEKEWKAQVEQFIDGNRAAIEAILKDYGVPLVDESYASTRP